MPKRTHRRAVTGRAAALALSVLTTLAAARPARADFEAPPPPARRLGMAISAALAGVAIGVELVVPRFRFELRADATPPPPYPYPYAAPPPPPCCYQPPPPPPVVIAAPPPPVWREPDFPRYGVAVNGLIQSMQTAGTPAATAGLALSLQARTSRRSLFAVELQSLDAERSASRRRTDQAGLLVGRLFLWDHALAPYLELAGGLGRAAIDTQFASVATSEVIGRAGLGLELRLGPHLVLEGQVAQVYRLRLEHEPGGQPADPTFIGEREQATELRGGLAYRF